MNLKSALPALCGIAMTCFWFLTADAYFFPVSVGQYESFEMTTNPLCPEDPNQRGDFSSLIPKMKANGKGLLFIPDETACISEHRKIVLSTKSFRVLKLYMIPFENLPTARRLMILGRSNQSAQALAKHRFPLIIISEIDAADD